MARLAYAAARSDMSATGAFVPQPVRGDAPRRSRPVPAAGWGFGVVRRMAAVAAVSLLLVLAGLGAARVLDSQLLGFVFADLVFLVGIALRGALSGTGRVRRF